MNAHESRPLTAETVEYLLDRHPAARHHAHGLADRLTAASAVAFPGELAGEDAAVSAFMATSGVVLVPLAERSPMLKSALLAKLLTLKAAVVAVVAVSAGGVALAATTGVLPNPLAPDDPGHSASAPGQTNRTNGAPESPGANASPSPSLIGLCTAYLAGAGESRETVLKNPAFAALITAAGGQDKVDAYCDGLGVKAPGSANATDHPTGPSTTHPTSEPSHATGPPTSHPSS